MTDREFHLMSAIVYESIDNSCYSFVEDVEDSTAFIGITEHMQLPGRWLIVYRGIDDPKYLTNGDKKILPDHIAHFDDSDDALLMYRLVHHADNIPEERIRAVRAVNFFAWNQLNGDNYTAVAQQIHHTDRYNYKYAEIIFGKDCWSWGTMLLHDLPRQQAIELMNYCLDFYKDWQSL